jgi:hypothetical protein
VKCEQCQCEGAALASTYLGVKLGRDLCLCCRIVAYNRKYGGRELEEIEPGTDSEIVAAFNRMAERGERSRERVHQQTQQHRTNWATWSAYSLPTEGGAA